MMQFWPSYSLDLAFTWPLWYPSLKKTFLYSNWSMLNQMGRYMTLLWFDGRYCPIQISVQSGNPLSTLLKTWICSWQMLRIFSCCNLPPLSEATWVKNICFFSSQAFYLDFESYLSRAEKTITRMSALTTVFKGSSRRNSIRRVNLHPLF